MKLTARQIGILQVLGSGFCFGFLGVFGKWAYSVGVAPGELLSLRFLLSSAVLFTGLGLVRPRLLRLPPRDVLSCALLGVFGYAVFSSFYFEALQGLSASLTSLLLYTYPVLVAIAARLLFGERIGRLGLVALPLAAFGLVLLIWGDFTVNKRASFVFGLGSAVFYSVYILASSRWLKGVNPLASVPYIQLAAGTVLAFLHFPDAGRPIAVLEIAWPSLAGLALVSSAAAMTLFLAGLQKLKNAEASILSTAEPITAVVVGSLLLNESLGWMQLLGGALVLVALALIARGR